MSAPIPLELLAPAKTAAFGIEAVNHGADAVYIGGPGFGARAAADNSVADIAQLAAHAHRFGAQVFVALNTILNDHEVEPARQLAWALYEAGADALIVQDMGMLEMDLPPIALHASTQTDNRTPEKVRFLEQVGFSQVVLARELSLKDIRKIATQTTVPLEFFVHGALCVAFSGQCYISHAHTGRSANRGECSQACRLPYTLTDGEGHVITQGQHLLSVKDNDQSANLAALAEAGIRSFKIEGRYKDLGYVKNITAHYRQLLDQIIDADPRYRRASSGRCTYTFTPQTDKTFNRGATDYFVNERQHGIEAFDSPAFVGEPIGRVSKVDPARRAFSVEVNAPIHNGDGLAWYTPKGEVSGLRVNTAEGDTLFAADPLPPELVAGTTLFRNHDQAFVRALEKPSAERRIPIDLRLDEDGARLRLTAADADGHHAEVCIDHAQQLADHPERALATLREAIGKLGNTIFSAAHIEIALEHAWFLPNAQINAARRNILLALEAARLAAYPRPTRQAATEPPPRYPDSTLSYLGNVFNSHARAFYARHGVEAIEPAYEENAERGEVSLMITKHCLRYSFNLCPKEVKGLRPDPMVLVNGKERLTLKFDCKRCEMHVVGGMKKMVWQGGLSL
ncbi:MAG: U32 family peptidase [Betaproteobacteria bacterium]|nr:MAG: U32 family peptidase [Betaproteobacteria bacterium]